MLSGPSQSAFNFYLLYFYFSYEVKYFVPQFFICFFVKFLLMRICFWCYWKITVFLFISGWQFFVTFAPMPFFLFFPINTLVIVVDGSRDRTHTAMATVATIYKQNVSISTSHRQTFGNIFLQIIESFSVSLCSHPVQSDQNAFMDKWNAYFYPYTYTSYVQCRHQYTSTICTIHYMWHTQHITWMPPQCGYGFPQKKK